MRKVKVVSLLCLTLLFAFIAFHFSSVKYGIIQAIGQLRVIKNTQEINELRKNPSTPDSLIEQFDFIDKIRAFAEDSLGLNVGDNYTTFYDQKGKPILWSVTASPEFQIKAYEWKFPLVGSFPYKGFFDFEKAEEEENKLKVMGYDTEIDEVSAWSTLGILNDPVLSSMLNRSDGKLAELIIHESTHATIYLKDQGRFNENLASFIGRKGASLFLIEQYGIESMKLKAYLTQLEKSSIFKHYMRDAIRKLKIAYQKMDDDLTNQEKRAIKKREIEKLKDGLRETGYFSSDSIADSRLKKFHPNNAYFSGFSTYAEGQDQLEKKLEEEFNGNLKSMISSIKEKGLSLFNE